MRKLRMLALTVVLVMIAAACKSEERRTAAAVTRPRTPEPSTS